MKFDYEKYPKFDFIADGLLSVEGLADGRALPCIIIDNKISKEIVELCEAHKNSPQGDVETTWVRTFTITKPKEIMLKICFKKPIAFTFAIIFDMYKHFNLIDGIVISQSLRIEAGEIGDKVSDLKNPDILIEVQRTNFAEIWENYLKEVIKKKYREKGIPKHQIKQLINQHIKSMREIWKIRID